MSVVGGDCGDCGDSLIVHMHCVTTSVGFIFESQCSKAVYGQEGGLFGILCVKTTSSLCKLIIAIS